MHYLIHATDSPRFAERGLNAARPYDRLAPDADHALHMPSHIFLQLGMWDDVVASNERAWAAALAWVARGRHRPAEVGWHSLQWLQYGYLQQGRWRAAYALLDSARLLLDTASAAALAGYPDVRYTVETLAFQYGNETEQWSRVLPLLTRAAEMVSAAPRAASLREEQMANGALYHAAIGAVLGARDTTSALANLRALNARAQSVPAASPLHAAAAAMVSHASALVAATGGRRDSVVAELTRAAAPASRDAGSAPIGPPTTIPAFELLGALLLEAGRGAEAVDADADLPTLAEVKRGAR